MQRQLSHFSSTYAGWRLKAKETRRIGIWRTACFDWRKDYDTITMRKKTGESRLRDPGIRTSRGIVSFR